MQDKRHLLRCIPVLTEEEGNFCAKRLMQRAWLSKKKVSDRTVRRCLNENGYYYLRTHKKSLMSKTIRENAGYSQNKYRTTIQRMYGFRKLLFTSMVYSGPQGSLRIISQHILNSSKHILNSQYISKSSQHISKSPQHIRPRTPSVGREKGMVMQLLLLP